MILPTGIFQNNEQVLIKYFHIFSIYFCVLAIGERQISSVGEQTYTLDEAVEHIGFGLYHVIVIVIAGLSWVSIIYLESVAKRYYIHKYFTITLFLRVLKKGGAEYATIRFNYYSYTSKEFMAVRLIAD